MKLRYQAVLNFILLLCGIAFSNCISAQWYTDPTENTLISTPLNSITTPKIISDGSGGSIFIWRDCHDAIGGCAIYAQRVNASGTAQWTINGIKVGGNNWEHFKFDAIPEAMGGAIITWLDYRVTAGSFPDVYAQKISASGITQWTAEGVAICTLAAIDKDNPKLTTDGSGGAIITWSDTRLDGGHHIYAQRINADGLIQWTTDGIAICTAAHEQSGPFITDDGIGGAFIDWTDHRQNKNVGVYAQHVTGSGTALWSSNGIQINDAVSNQSTAGIVNDSAGGVIMFWYDDRIIQGKIFAQRVNASGTFLWSAEGVPTTSNTFSRSQEFPAVSSDGSGGAIIAWQDLRNGVDEDIIAQKINAAGAVQWTADGITVCGITHDQLHPSICSDANGGAVIAWEDRRTADNSYDLFGQRVNATGASLWTSNGVAASLAPGYQLLPAIFNDGSGFVIAWIDGRKNSFDLYAQKMNSNGVLAGNCPAPGVWLGGVSDDWLDAANWCSGSVPAASTDVVIPAGTLYLPVVRANVSCKTLTIKTGASITVNSGVTLMVLSE